ncbi:MAG TPA: hypothetical protein CFH79_01410 [Sulfurospirillum sp. UBA11407]|nr:MAG TPA: hypothetical protein CFH79_01410 [Sulfurospirillum sp. UBA11407]
MKKKILFVGILIFGVSLFAKEEVKMESVLNQICEHCIKVYDSCSGEFVEIRLSEDEYLYCREPEKVSVDTLIEKPKVALEECEEGNLKSVQITDKNQLLEIYDHARGKRMLVEIGDNGTIKCKDIKVIKEKKSK